MATADPIDREPEDPDADDDENCPPAFNEVDDTIYDDGENDDDD